MKAFNHVPVLVLTVEPANGARRQNMAAQFIATGAVPEFVVGATGSDPSLDALYAPVLNRLLAKRSLATAEIAIYEGHRRIWKRIVAGGSAYALVFEDDAQVPDMAAFGTAVEDLLAAPEGWDIVKFFDFRPKPVVRTMKCGATTLAAYKYPASGAVAYLVKSEAAQRLLSRKRIYRPVDEDFSHCWEFGLRVWSTLPNLVTEVSHTLGGSLVEDERQAMKRNHIRSIWGNVLQARKLIRSKIYNRQLRKDAEG